ncbi:hypothetical protein CMI48_01075 [Candidatus Pacearchaeota archaeon]|nr:hypothetical protein [Candidatus Pacearchaeota archaeon]|tara:strand:+ start:156 stop:1049 length:894 start_codon:yes stop_codon:yes gene_type:complete
MPLITLREEGESQSWLEANLTSEEYGTLNGPGRKSHRYFPPERVTRYFSGDEQKEFQEILHFEVHIKRPDKWIGDLAGRYYFIHEYGKDQTDFILSGVVEKEDVEKGRIDPQHVEEDLSGKIIPITREFIDGMIQREIEAEKEGTKLRDAEYLAELAGFKEYDEKIKDARETIGRKRFERFSSPENLGKLFTNLEEERDYHSELFWGEYGKDINTLSQRAKEIVLPEHLREKAEQVFLRIAEYQEGRSEVQTSEAEELEEQARGLRSTSQEARTEANFLKNLLIHQFKKEQQPADKT